MSKFKIGDRVRSKISGGCGQIVPFPPKYVHVQWDDGVRGIAPAEAVEPAEPIPDGLVIEIECIANYGGDRGVVNVKGITLDRLNGKFRIVPVE